MGTDIPNLPLIRVHPYRERNQSMSLSFAPIIGTVELIILNSLTVTAGSVGSKVLLGKLRTYEPFSTYSSSRFHVMMDRLIGKGLITKVKQTGKKAVRFKITASGDLTRSKAIEFFSSF